MGRYLHIEGGCVVSEPFCCFLFVPFVVAVSRSLWPQRFLRFWVVLFLFFTFIKKGVEQG
jgi:hypothetical protein